MTLGLAGTYAVAEQPGRGRGDGWPTRSRTPGRPHGPGGAHLVTAALTGIAVRTRRRSR